MAVSGHVNTQRERERERERQKKERGFIVCGGRVDTRPPAGVQSATLKLRTKQRHPVLVSLKEKGGINLKNTNTERERKTTMENGC